MGITIPDDFPELDPTKWYKVTVQAYQGGGPPYDCTMDFLDNFSDCKTGFAIQNWIDLTPECFAGNELVVVTGFSAQRLKNIEGPFDTEAACELA